MAGAVAGPGTALVWSITDFSKAIMPKGKLATLAGLVSRSVFFWLKYFDHFMKNNPAAIDSASCTYFYGRKSETASHATDIFSKYKAMHNTHV